MNAPVSGLIGFTRVQAIDIASRKLLVELPNGDHGIYEIDGFYHGDELLPVDEWAREIIPLGVSDEDAVARYVERIERAATACRFTSRETVYELPLGSNLGEFLPIGTA